LAEIVSNSGLFQTAGAIFAIRMNQRSDGRRSVSLTPQVAALTLTPLEKSPEAKLPAMANATR
jgi:hypothetical protein